MAETIDATLAEIARLLDANLVGPVPNSKRILVPTGTLAAGVWHLGDPVDLVCFSDNTATIFWAVVEEAFDLPPAKVPKDAKRTLSSPDLKRSFGPGLITIRYCPFQPDPQGHDAQWDGLYGFGSRRTLAEEQNRAMALDAIEVIASIRQSDMTHSEGVFREAYNLLHTWFTSCGLLHRPSGYMDSEGLLYLLYATWTDCNKAHFDNDTSQGAWGLVEHFIRNTSTTVDANFTLRSPWKRLLSSHLTLSAIQTTQEAFAALNRSTSDLRSALAVSTEQAYRTFVTEASTDAHLLAFSTESYSTKSSELYPFIDNLPVKLVSCLRTRSDLHARIWPHPIVHANPHDGSGVHITYIVAIKPSLPETSVDISCIASQTTDAMMQAAPSGIFYSLTTIDDPRSLITDTPAPTPLPSLNLIAPAPSATTSHDPNRPFRPAGKALSRALHDPAHQLTEFEVGYTDRFDGLLWMALAEWGNKATEEEDFIPEHRVQKLRRVADGVVVWDREERRDWL